MFTRRMAGPEERRARAAAARVAVPRAALPGALMPGILLLLMAAPGAGPMRAAARPDAAATGGGAAGFSATGAGPADVGTGPGPAAGGAVPRGVESPPAPPAAIPCGRVLRAFDGAGRPLFQTIAVALPAAGFAAVPLHPLERGGARWERLALAGPAGSMTELTRLVDRDPEANLAILAAPGLEACGDRGEDDAAIPGPVPGAALRLLRERIGYRPAVIGGRVERGVMLPGGRALILVRLLDDGGADPALVFDAAGRLLGATLPAPPAGRPTLAAFVARKMAGAGNDMVGHTGDAGRTADPPAVALPTEAPDAAEVRAALPPRETPSAVATAAGLVAQALLAGGPGAAERGALLLGQVLRRDGVTSALLIERGVLQFGSGRISAAIADFEQASLLDPASHIARFNLGIALGTTGRYADAATAFMEARRLSPGHARTRYQLALALQAARRPAEARLECESLERIDPTLARDLRSALGI